MKIFENCTKNMAFHVLFVLCIFFFFFDKIDRYALCYGAV